MYPPGISDGINCGVYTIARAEAHILHNGILMESNPNELRAQYLELLFNRHILGATQQSTSDKMFEDSDEENEIVNVGQAKTITSTFLLRGQTTFERLERENTKEAILEYWTSNISSMGSDWVAFFVNEVQHTLDNSLFGRTEPCLPEWRIYYVLNQVAALGCHEVLLGLVKVFKASPSLVTNPLRLRETTKSCGVEYYRNVKDEKQHFSVRLRIISVWLYVQNEILEKWLKTVIARNNAARKREARMLKSKGLEVPARPADLGVPKASSYSPYYFIAECIQGDVNYILDNKASYETQRQEHEDFKGRGHGFQALSKLFELEYTEFALPTVIPVGTVRSPFDRRVLVTEQR